MAKKNDLKKTADDLRSLAEQLIIVADSLDQDGKQQKEKSAAKKELSYTDVRKLLAEKSRAGHTAEVKQIIREHGAEKLSELDPKEYDAVLREAEVL